MTMLTDAQLQNELNSLTVEKFQKDIDKIMRKGETSYIDAICEYCAKNNIEIETVAELISGNLKNAIAEEGEALKMLIPQGRIKL